MKDSHPAISTCRLHTHTRKTQQPNPFPHNLHINPFICLCDVVVLKFRIQRVQRLGLNQSLQQKLSPQQIQFIKLLQVPTAELENRIEEELEINPALEEGPTDETDAKDQDDNTTEEAEQPVSS